MGYNRANLLNKIIEIQTLTLQYQKKGYYQKWIYKNIVYPKYRISLSTYNNYLGINAKKELKELEAQKDETIVNQSKPILTS